jgi:hypothetical protein
MPNERQLLQNAPGILGALLSPTPLGIGALAANVGASFLAGRDQDKARKQAQKQQDQNVAMANLINSFGGRATPSPVQPKQGIGAPARLLSALGQSLPVIAGLQDKSQQRARQARMDDLIEQNVQSQVEARDLAGKQRQGALQSKLFQSFGRLGANPSTEIPVRVDSMGKGTSTMEQMEQMPISETSPPFNVLSSLAEGARMQRADDLKIGKTQAEIDLLDARTGQLTEPKERSVSDILGQFSPIVDSMAKEGKPFDEFIAQNRDVPAAVIDTLRASYNDTTQQIIQDEDADLHDLLYKDVAGKLNQNSFMKSAPQVGQAFTLVAKGYEEATGVGDLQMVTGMVRMAEPGLSVREAEARAVADAAGYLERWKVIGSGDKFLSGDTMTDKQRNRLLKLAEETYKTQANLVDHQLTKDMESIRARVMEVTPRMMADKRQSRMDQFEDTYRLPPTSIYGYTKRPDAPNETPKQSTSTPLLGGAVDSVLQWIEENK